MRASVSPTFEILTETGITSPLEKFCFDTDTVIARRGEENISLERTCGPVFCAASAQIRIQKTSNRVFDIYCSHSLLGIAVSQLNMISLKLEVFGCSVF